MSKLRVGVLGATGAVGQWLVRLLDGHPALVLSDVVASDRSAGHRYGEVVDWRAGGEPPAEAAGLTVHDLEREPDADLLLSALDAEVAGEAEERLAAQGFPVVSNSRNHRMDSDVPLLVPEVNPGHLEALTAQRRRRSGGGFIVTNPNCSTIGLVMVLKPLWDHFGLEAVQVVTMQAISGAGLEGVPAAAIQDNVIPHIAGEEAKLESEPRKILGRWEEGFVPASLRISAQCNRVPVLHGHLEAVSVRLGRPARLEEFREALADFGPGPEVSELPSSPGRAIILRDEIDRPQPRLDLDAERGMAVTVGGVRPCPVLDWKFNLLSHNLVRGAAGAALLNAELLLRLGRVGRRA